MADSASPSSGESSSGDSPTEEPKLDFLRQIVADDVAAGSLEEVRTRFPPEPNGYPHIGHAKSINVNFGIAREFGGRCNLRFDDTNPAKEDEEYVHAIIEDIRWLGFEPDAVLFASDYFPQLFAWAEEFVRRGWAYVDTQSLEAVRAQRGTASTPGENSPDRDRDPAENLELLYRMRAGDFGDGEATLRAKIDMASTHLILRDPLMYRIRHAEHHRTGNDWCLYPMYDWAHGQSDAIEGITHSICTLEFETHKPLYNWFLERIAEFDPTLGCRDRPEKPGESPRPPRQFEFARLKLAHAMTSKRKLLELVESGVVDGWDDARMPTLRGLRNRGVTAAAINEMCRDIGLTRFNGLTLLNLLENPLRSELNRTAQRRMAVLDPLPVTVTNWDQLVADGSLGELSQQDGEAVVSLEAVNNPENEADGTREVPFGRTFVIERADFLEDPPKKFFRLGPGREVRLRWAYFFTCTEFDKNDDGEITALRGTIDPATRGGNAPDGRKVKGTIHWVGPGHLPLEIVTDEPLLSVEDPGDLPDDDWRTALNEPSRSRNTAALGEPSLAEIAEGQTVQFERHAYYKKVADRTFSRVVTLRESKKPKGT